MEFACEYYKNKTPYRENNFLINDVHSNFFISSNKTFAKSSN